MQQGTARRILEERMKRGQEMQKQRIEEIRVEARREAIGGMLRLYQPILKKQEKKIKKLKKKIKYLKGK